MSREEWEGQKSNKDIILGILFVMMAIAGGILILTVPVEELLGEGIYRMRGAFHGFFAGVFMITATIGFYQGFRLWRGTVSNVREMEVGGIMNAAACFFTILSGNWIYIPYRSFGGPRTFFLEMTPQVQEVFFEFKQFAALFTLPLAVSAAFLICRYAEHLNENEELRDMAALLLILTFFFFMIPFGLGASITKLMPV
jgi:hypothetical protein